MDNEIISVRELSRRIGTSDKAILKAINIGRIVNCVVKNDKGTNKIDYEKALIELKEINFNSLSSKKTEIKEKKHSNNHEKQPKQDNSKILTKKNEETGEEEYVGGLGPETTLITATRAEKIYKAQLLCLEVDKQKGILVDKKEVYADLYEFGLEVKKKLLAIPDRITDQLIALSNDRMKFNSLLSLTIETELEILSRHENS